jgi:nitroimidazol reductase NimA-like FMN-containing flavoprotein (pyridoxamine 5'-phosphate oxidase superfamily)
MPGYGVPEGAGSLKPWSWARERLEASRNYWLATVRPDSRPHLIPIWGVWLDGQFYFSTGAESRKAKNLRTNQN